MMAVTLSGQLMVIDLIERLTEAGVEVVSANTDGLFIRPERKTTAGGRSSRSGSVTPRWSSRSSRLKRLAIVATNNYATLDTKGKIKRQGAAFKGRCRRDGRRIPS